MKIDRPLLVASWRSWVSNDNRKPEGPWWLQWVWTLLFCAALAVAFTLLGFVTHARDIRGWGDLAGWAHWYVKNLIVCLTIGGLIHLLFDASRHTFATPERIGRWSSLQRTLFFAGTPMLGLVLGWPLGVILAGADLQRWITNPTSVKMIAGSLLLSLMIMFLLHHYFAGKVRQYQAEKRATEAQLRLLQAQIEPHFLFNTLANVLALIDHDTPKARQMLQAFTDYLRSSLTALRQEEGPLSQELELARNYLQLQQSRMEDRLRWSIDADEATLRLPLPPLLLQPLVENAVIHGLEPSIEGGQVQVSARIRGRQLVLDVRDDGVAGNAATRHPARPNGGMALDNIRQRLQARFGSGATLDVSAAAPGTLARMTIPLPPHRS